MGSLPKNISLFESLGIEFFEALFKINIISMEIQKINSGRFTRYLSYTRIIPIIQESLVTLAAILLGYAYSFCSLGTQLQ